LCPEPQSVELSINGKTDKCSLGEDINFQFTGFGIVGKVRLGNKSTVNLYIHRQWFWEYLGVWTPKDLHSVYVSDSEVYYSGFPCILESLGIFFAGFSISWKVLETKA